MDNVGSGLGGQFGIAPETTYGTYVAPSKFLEITKVDLKKKKNTVQGGGIAAGRVAQLGSRRKVVTQAVEGSVEMEVANKLMGLLLQTLIGTTVTPVQQDTTAAYLQTHVVAASAAGKSLTMQVGVPLTTGTVSPFTYLGCKILSAEFTCEVDGLLTVAWTIDGQKLDESQTLGVASYSTTLSPFHWGQGVVKIGTFGAEAITDGIKSFTLKIERKMATDRFYLGNGGLKNEPITNGWMEVSGSFTVDYMDKADFNDRFSSDAPFSTVIEFVGDEIEAPYSDTIRFELPMSFLEGDTPGLDGPEIVSGNFPFVTQLDGTHPLATVEVISTESAL